VRIEGDVVEVARALDQLMMSYNSVEYLYIYMISDIGVL
jgi:hypothetical protein